MPVDYKALWEELINDLGHIEDPGITEMYPEIVKEHMLFMVHRESTKQDEKSSRKPGSQIDLPQA